MIRRNIESRVIEALKDNPVVLVNGARQTGKSTLVGMVGEKVGSKNYLTFDDASVLASASSDPQGFINAFSSNVIIDEIQRVPDLFRAIKLSVDKDRKPGRFLLTGSANLFLLPKLSESLAGRMEVLTLRPFSQGEIDGFDGNFVDRLFSGAFEAGVKMEGEPAEMYGRVVRGGYPEAVFREDPARRSAWFESYITTILQRDVRDLANVTALSEMPRLLSFLASRTSGLMNASDISRDLHMPYTTLKRYLALFETVFMIHFVPAFSVNTGKRLVKAPKMFLCDTGLAAHLLNAGVERISSEQALKGRLPENLVFTELLKFTEWSSIRAKIHHFRSVSGLEVDFVLEDGSGLTAGVEVKASSTVDVSDFAALKFLAETIGDGFKAGVVLYNGDRTLPFGNKLWAVPIRALWKQQ